MRGAGHWLLMTAAATLELQPLISEALQNNHDVWVSEREVEGLVVARSSWPAAFRTPWS